MKQPTHEFVDSYKEFRSFFAEMRDYAVAKMRPSDITDADLDEIAMKSLKIAAWAKYLKDNY